VSPRDVRTRDRLAGPVLLAYWLLLIGGLGLYTASRLEDLGEVAPIWIGCLGGTALAQILALRDYRMWISAVIVLAVPVFVGPFVPWYAESNLWMTYLPAALCGYLALGDRVGLAPFWFPAVVWMLSILDRFDARGGMGGLDGSGALLLAGLAVLLLAALRAREYRRVGLWRGVGATRLAVQVQSEVLKETPGRRLAGAVWTGGVAAATFALTAWIAPHLWQREALPGGVVAVHADALAFAGAGGGLPCCPDAQEEAPRSRVREYLDLGRGHLEPPPPMRPGVDCRLCDGAGVLPGGFGGTAALAPPAPAPLPPAPVAAAAPPAPAAPVAPSAPAPDPVPAPAPLPPPAPAAAPAPPPPPKPVAAPPPAPAPPPGAPPPPAAAARCSRRSRSSRTRTTGRRRTGAARS
jgi:hypothetical protein